MKNIALMKGVNRSLILVLSFSFLLFVRCNSVSDKKNVTQNTPPQQVKKIEIKLTPGEIIPNVPCSADPSITYALYVPAYYDTSLRLAIICFFDPHGDGSLPLTKYKTIADIYGFILCGSNHSRNGMPIDAASKGAVTFINDVKERVKFDANGLYLAGFSGGSRVAGNTAVSVGGIAGVIGCSASIPDPTGKVGSRFTFFGIAGTGDFNMREMKALDKQLDNSTVRHFLQFFDGKHEWCPVATMEEAMKWLALTAMKDKVVIPNDSFINNIQNKLIQEVNQNRLNGAIYEGWYSEKKLIAFMDGLRDVTSYKKQVSEIENSQAYKNQLQYRQGLEQQEDQMRSKYSQAFNSQDEKWWENEMRKMNTEAKTLQITEQKQSVERVLGSLSISAYMQVNNALKSSNWQEAEKFITLYKFIDPTNPEHAYLSGCVEAKKGNSEKAIDELNEAIKLGFTDYSRMYNDSMLTSLKPTQAFKVLTDQIKK